MTPLSRRSVLIGAAAWGVAPVAARAVPGPNLPAPLAGRGFNLVWADEFDTLDIGATGHRWAPNLWYEHPAGPDQYAVADSILTLKCLRRGEDWAGCQLATEWADTRGGSFFRGGYFEARMKVPRAWPAFWLFSANHSRGVTPRRDDPATLCGEIDIYEGDSAHPNWFCGALHRNTGGQGGINDQYNHNNCQDLRVDLTRDWHDYAVLWTERAVIWYLDGRETHRAPAYDSTWQDAFIVLGIEPGGLLGGPMPPEAGEVDLLVDWVRVWTGGRAEMSRTP
jgi:hypothetical protein